MGQPGFARLYLHGDAAVRRQQARRAVKSGLNTTKHEIDIVGDVDGGDRTQTAKIERRVGDRNNGSRRDQFEIRGRVMIGVNL